MRSIPAFRLWLPLLALAAAPWACRNTPVQPDGERTSENFNPILSSQPTLFLPDLSNGVEMIRTAITWFGQVTPLENYVDLRAAYTNEKLLFHFTIMDRRVWYDLAPTPDRLEAWDSATVLLRLSEQEAAAPDSETYRFVCQLRWWQERNAYQAAYQGNGGGWERQSLDFWTGTRFHGDTGGEVNQDQNVFGWSCEMSIPLLVFGRGVPADGTVWRAAFIVHDRDDKEGTPIPEAKWPSSAVEQDVPSTWGRLAFGLPVYQPPAVTPGVTFTIKQGQDGATVPDAAVGGGTDCGGEMDQWTQWGEKNYVKFDRFNIGNLMMISDLRCISKYYVTFPLTVLPVGKTVLSAKLVLHQIGNCDPSQALPSCIQVLLVGQDWQENTLTWNNAPIPIANAARTVVGVMPEGGSPGLPREWDVSWAVSESYRTGVPLRLALYSADSAINSGKYFASSDIEDYYATTRPTLMVELSE